MKFSISMLKRKPKKYDLTIVAILNGLHNRSVNQKVESCHITYSHPFRCVRVTIDPGKRQHLLTAWDETSGNFGGNVGYKTSLIHANLVYFTDDRSKLDLSDEKLTLDLRKYFPALFKFIMEQKPLYMKAGKSKSFGKIKLTPMREGFMLTCTNDKVCEALKKTLDEWDFKFEIKSSTVLKLQY